MATDNQLTVRQFSVAKGTALAQVQSRIAEIARGLNAEIMNADPRPSAVTRIVDGVVGALEETVRAQIVYRYTRLDQPIIFALAFLKQISPVGTGKDHHPGLFRDSWFAMVDGERTEDFSRIPAGAVITITNDQPYSRKIDVGGMRLSVPPHLVDQAAQVVSGRYGNSVTAQASYVTLQGGYVMKGHGTHARRKLRKDVAAGQPMTYPALIIQGR